MRLRSRPASHLVRTSSFEELGPLMLWAVPDLPLRLDIPMEWARMQGAFAYRGGWHPFVAALESGPAALEEFYSRFRPANLAQMYGLAEGEAGSHLPPWELPWQFRLERKPPPGEAGLGPEHGVAFYGPATEEKVRVEFERLTRLRDSIAKRGYDADEKGGIAGCFLRRGGEWRFFVRGGKHRAAALSALGEKRLTVGFRSNWPRVVDAAAVRDWPLVHDGTVAEGFALKIFERYFDHDGTQQREGWGR